MECFPQSEPTLDIQLVGAVYATVTKGKRKGKPNWDARICPKTTVILPLEEHNAWVVQWEIRTGNCAKCVGTGEALHSVSKAGTEYRPCGQCGGTGKRAVK